MGEAALRNQFSFPRECSCGLRMHKDGESFKAVSLYYIHRCCTLNNEMEKNLVSGMGAHMWNSYPGTRLMLLSPLENSGNLVLSGKWLPCNKQHSH